MKEYSTRKISKEEMKEHFALINDAIIAADDIKDFKFNVSIETEEVPSRFGSFLKPNGWRDINISMRLFMPVKIKKRREILFRRF